MNVFLHDFQTLEDYNDVAEWIKSSDIDPEKSTIIFLADLAGAEKTGVLFIGSSFNLLSHIGEMTGELITRTSKTKDAAIDLAFAINRAVCKGIEKLYEKNGGEPS